MKKKVLFADNNQILCRLIQKKFGRYKGTFSVITATDGLEALNELKQQPIAVVITNLQLPQMDGFALLTHLAEYFPDIPVIVQTGESTPKAKQYALESGAVSFIQQPFKVEDLGQLILSILEKESNGGILKRFSLEMFIQLIELEMKTCTVRVDHGASGERGILFFREGGLMDARILDRRGEKVALEIFCWGDVTFSVEEDCRLAIKKIDADLQSLVFEAIRYKDEAVEVQQTTPESADRRQLSPEHPPPPASDFEQTSDFSLTDILEIKDVKGVMSMAVDGSCNFSQFLSKRPENIDNINWPSFFQALNGVREAELTFEDMRFFLRKTLDEYILVVLGKAVPVEMVRRECERLASNIKAKG